MSTITQLNYTDPALEIEGNPELAQRAGMTLFQDLFLAFYLALKEVIRNRGRFFLVSLVIALITLLVLSLASQRLRPPKADGLVYRRGEH